MELFIDPRTPETFLIRLVASYLKLEERGKLKIIQLSDVLPDPRRMPFLPSKMATSNWSCPPSSQKKERLWLKLSKSPATCSRCRKAGNLSSWELQLRRASRSPISKSIWRRGKTCVKYNNVKSVSSETFGIKDLFCEQPSDLRGLLHVHSTLWKRGWDE